jgi:hypothetical protein
MTQDLLSDLLASCVGQLHHVQSRVARLARIETWSSSVVEPLGSALAALDRNLVRNETLVYLFLRSIQRRAWIFC